MKKNKFIRAGLFNHPPSVAGKTIPKRVRIVEPIKSAVPGIALGKESMSAKVGEEFECYVNPYGALFVTLEGGTIGLRPSEFEIIEWKEQIL